MCAYVSLLFKHQAEIYFEHLSKLLEGIVWKMKSIIAFFFSQESHAK